MAGISIIDLAERHMSGEIVWGTRDCCTGPCDIFKDLYGVDPMWPMRGTYSDKFEARREIMLRGGWLKMTQGLADLSGLKPGCGHLGEIGVTVASSANHAAGRCLAISAGNLGWILKTKLGYMVVETDIIERSWGWQTQSR